MERRDEKRRARRMPIRFWKRGEEKARSGFTTNISTGGMFIGSSLIHGRGTRIRVEVLDPIHGFVVEGVVARAIRSQPHMQHFRASGMGIRFLQVAELVEELFPMSARTGEPSGKSVPILPGESTFQEGTGPASTAVPEPEAGEEVVTGLTPFSYALQYRHREELRASFERDISQGGLFITTPSPAPLQEIVVIEIQVQGVVAIPVRLRAKVVHRVDPESEGEPNLLAGMGLEILDPAQAREDLLPLLA